MAKYDLSVAIIFKNEIRCLERCLKSLQPLRERISLQIVMADTGATDGSRAIAEQYADILVDFPWINDFAAARNATLERCQGRWTLVLDCDEWLEDTDKLTQFVRKQTGNQHDVAMVPIRNYNNEDLDSYTVIFGSRLLCMASHPHYKGVIHEYPVFGTSDQGIRRLVDNNIVIYHDGYVMLNNDSAEGKAKLRRNADLLKSALEKNPDDLRALNEYIECAGAESDYLDTLKRAVKLATETKDPAFAPVVFCRAVQAANDRNMPEIEEWARTAKELFPDNYLIRLDISYLMADAATQDKRWEDAESWSKEYLKARRKYLSDPRGTIDTMFGAMRYGDEASECVIRLVLAESRRGQGRYEDSYFALKEIDYENLPLRLVGKTLYTITQLFLISDLNFDALMVKFWDGIQSESISKTSAEKRTKAFLFAGKRLFGGKFSADTGERIAIVTSGTREPWEIFLPLANECELGNIAELLVTKSGAEAEMLLAKVENITELPAAAFLNALKAGAEFPIPGKALHVEVADIMANKLSTDPNFLREATIFAATAFESDADLNWARGLALAALQSTDWKEETDPQLLLRAIIRIESAFLAKCYSAHALQNSGWLPPMHRFALHLVNAYTVLAPSAVSSEFTPAEIGGVRAALAELKEAVKDAPEQKTVVDVVLDSLLGGTV